MRFGDFFDATKPSSSMGRLLNFITICSGVILVLTVVGYVVNALWFNKVIDVNILGFFSMPIITLFAFGLGAKVGQSFAEKSMIVNTENKDTP
jgi:hypothetical protein